MNRLGPRWRDYALAIALVIVAATVKLALARLIEGESPFLLFFIAVLLSAWLGGLGPGLVATLLSALISWFGFQDAEGALAGRLIRTSIFGMEGILISALADWGKRASGASLRDSAARDAEHRAREQQTAEFVATFEQAAVGIAHIGLDGAFLRVNSRLCEITGRSREILQQPGMMLQDITHPDDREAGLANRRRLVAGEVQTYSGVERYQRGDGGSVWAKVSGSLARTEDGNPKYFIHVIEDITAERELRDQFAAANRRLRSHLQNTPLAVIEWDAEFRVTSWSGRAEEMFGWAASEVLGKGPLDWPFVAAEDHAMTQEAMRELLEGSAEGAVIPNRNLSADGGVMHCVWYVSVVRDDSGRLLSVLTLAQDVTAQRESEEALRQLTAELEQRVVSRTAELQRVNEDLSSFAYVASHDLQEPLRTVGSYTQLLARRYKGKLDTDADEFIQFAVEGVKRMQTLIEDLLEFSRVGRDSMRRQRVKLEDVILRVLRDLQGVIEDTHAAIDAELRDVTVQGDPARLAQLFDNLLQNSLKYRSEGVPRILIRAERAEDSWCISVEDNGIGVAPEYRERVFQIFQRLHTREQYSGTGIGLAICRRIVEAHGGTIRIEQPRELGGARFEITLPMAQEEPH